MSTPSVVIIWCDGSFETSSSYQSMQDEFNQTTTGTSAQQEDRMDVDIVNNATAHFHSNNVPLIVTRTIDEAKKKIEEHSKEKIFVICSASVGRFFLPIISSELLYIHDVFIYAHGPARHMDLITEYGTIVKMFDFHTTLLIRLTHEIAKYFIDKGEGLLRKCDGRTALQYFQQAQKLEMEANKRSKTSWNVPGTAPPRPDYRKHLDRLECPNGLIAQAIDEMHRQGLSVQNY